MEKDAVRIHFRPLRAVRTLRVVVLLLLAGFAVALVVSYGRRGKPQTEITMAAPSASPGAAGAVVDSSDEFAISGTREGRPAFTLRARSVTGFAGDRKLLDGVSLEIHDEQGGIVRVSGSEGQFDAARKRAQISGDVEIAGEDGLSLKSGTLFYDSDRDMVFTADDVTFTAGGLEGQGRGLNYLVGERQIKIPDRVALKVVDDAAGGTLAVTSADLVAALGDNTAVFTDDVRMTRGGDVLHANYLKLFLDEQRRTVTRLSAFGDVVAVVAPSVDGPGGELRSDALAARPSGAASGFDEVDASGDCRFTSGEYTARGRTLRFARGDDRLELRGDPVVMSGGDRIAAQEIDLHPAARTLEARGDVRTVSLGRPGDPGAAAAAIPGAAGGAISFQARELRADQAARRAVYSGSARAWQEGNSLQAEEIVLDDAARQVRATRNVMARFTQRPPSGGPAARPTMTSITADTMVLDEKDGIARYRGNVRLARLDATLTADAMDAFMAERGGARELSRILATGSVAVKQAGSYGSARTAEYRAAEDVLVLEDDAGLAEVVDAATGRTMRGRTLTFDLAGDRILTESARGARTWITLTPDSKDAHPVEPKTRH